MTFPGPASIPARKVAFTPYTTMPHTQAPAR